MEQKNQRGVIYFDESNTPPVEEHLTEEEKAKIRRKVGLDIVIRQDETPEALRERYRKFEEKRAEVSEE